MKKSEASAVTRKDIANMQQAIFQYLDERSKTDKEELVTRMGKSNEELSKRMDMKIAESQEVLSKRMDMKIAESQEVLMDRMGKNQEELFHYFDLKTEQLTHDYRGIFSDRTMQHHDQLHDHEQRLSRVEKNIGLSA